jgi:hypothetical protein
MRACAISLCCLCLLAAAPARSQQPPRWWGVASIGSHHFERADRYLGEGGHFREFNPGVGLEVQWRPRHAMAVGYFRNSVDHDSLYALYQYTPLQLGRYVRVGGMLGLISGYPGYNDGGIAPGGGFVMKAEGDHLGTNLILLPRIPDSTPWTLGLQVKYRFR